MYNELARIALNGVTIMFLRLTGMDLKKRVILDSLKQNGDQTIEQLAQQIHATPLTARRHLRQLLATGLVGRDKRSTHRGNSYRYVVHYNDDGITD